MNSNKTLLSFASVKTFYDCTTKDEFFRDLVVYSLYKISEEKSSGISISDIKNHLQDNFTEMPESYIKIVLEGLRRTGMIKYKTFHDLSLTSEGRNKSIVIKDRLESNQYRINQYLKDIVGYIKPILNKKSDREFNDDDISNILNDTLLFAFDDKSVKKNNDVLKEIFDYIDKDENIKKKFEFFGYGAIIQKTFRELYSENSKIGDIKIYLDTNIVFSIFGIGDKEIKDELNKFLRLCIQNKIKFYVLPKTIEEFKNTLRLSSMICANITQSEKNDILYNVKEKLYEEKIEIDFGALTKDNIDINEKELLGILDQLTKDSYDYRGHEHDKAVLSF